MPYSIAVSPFHFLIMPAELLTSRHQTTLILALSGSSVASLLQADIHAALIETLSTAESDPSLAAVVLSGLDHFSPQEGKAQTSLLSNASLEHLSDWIDALHDFPKLVIAAVEGQLSGPGLSLMLACDLVVAGHDSGFKAAPDMLCGLSWFLTRGLPRQFAMEMLLGSHALPAARLHALGLINRLVDDGQAHDEALAWADQLAHAASPTEGIKAVLRNAGQHTLAQQLAAEMYYRMEK